MSWPYNNAPAYRQDVIRVNGEPGARALALAPNSTALVLDETGPFVWFCQADGAGYKTVTPYRIEPVKVNDTNGLSALEDRIAKLEAMINEKSDS